MQGSQNSGAPSWRADSRAVCRTGLPLPPSQHLTTRHAAPRRRKPWRPQPGIVCQRQRHARAQRGPHPGDQRARHRVPGLPGEPAPLRLPGLGTLLVGRPAQGRCAGHVLRLLWHGSFANACCSSIPLGPLATAVRSELAMVVSATHARLEATHELCVRGRMLKSKVTRPGQAGFSV